MERSKLLLHACCAPCFSSPHELLKNDYDIEIFYSNSNIHPASEYKRRLDELFRFSALEKIPVHDDDYNPRDWFSMTREYRFEGERSRRCHACYRYRLERAFIFAVAEGFPCVGTVLSVSPHKDAGMINTVGKELSMKYGISFLEADFKKKDGFKRSLELSSQYGFYRQDYCGCVWSREERRKDSSWNRVACGNPVPNVHPVF